LTAPEAEMLTMLAGYENPIDQDALLEKMGAPPPRAPEPIPERQRLFVRIENLVRLGLCEIEPPEGGELTAAGMTFYPMRSKHWTSVGITRLGRAFLAACTPPGAIDG
jgi:hypothetical protein